MLSGGPRGFVGVWASSQAARRSALAASPPPQPARRQSPNPDTLLRESVSSNANQVRYAAGVQPRRSAPSAVSMHPWNRVRVPGTSKAAAGRTSGDVATPDFPSLPVAALPTCVCGTSSTAGAPPGGIVQWFAACLVASPDRARLVTGADFVHSCCVPLKSYTAIWCAADPLAVAQPPPPPAALRMRPAQPADEAAPRPVLTPPVLPRAHQLWESPGERERGLLELGAGDVVQHGQSRQGSQRPPKRRQKRRSPRG